MWKRPCLRYGVCDGEGGSGAQLEQVVRNLDVNARDARQERRSAHDRSADNVLLDLDYVRALVSTARPDVMLDRQRHGAAWMRRTQARIFETFFTTRTIGKAPSSACRRCIDHKQSNRPVEATAKKPPATSFKVYLPITGRR